MNKPISASLGLKIFLGVYLPIAFAVILREAHPGGGLQGIFSIMVSLPSFILFLPLMMLSEALPESIPDHVKLATLCGLAIITNALLLSLLVRKLGKRKTTP